MGNISDAKYNRSIIRNVYEKFGKFNGDFKMLVIYINLLIILYNIIFFEYSPSIKY